MLIQKIEWFHCFDLFALVAYFNDKMSMFNLIATKCMLHFSLLLNAEHKT